MAEISPATSAPTAGAGSDTALLDRARGGDDAAFTRLVAPMRGELLAHCYRMLGSVHDADDALQDALLRAWRAVGRFQGRSSLRTWLYTVATRTCLDALAGRSRRALPMELGPASDRPVVADAPRTEIAWLEPWPDERYAVREAVQLAFVAALQHLPGNQRAALLMAEVLGFPAAEIATTMGTSVASVNSALQRARRVVGAVAPDRDTASAPEDRALRDLAAGYAAALEAGDAAGLVALLTEDVTWSMPPMCAWYAGREAAMDFATAVPLASCGSWRHRVVVANGVPTVAAWLRPHDAPADAPHRFWSLNHLAARDGRIAAITSFVGEHHARAFGLPATLPSPT